MDQSFRIFPLPNSTVCKVCVLAIVAFMPVSNAQAKINNGIWKFDGDGRSILYRRERSEGGNDHSSSDNDNDQDGSGDSDSNGDSDGDNGNASSGDNSGSNRNGRTGRSTRDRPYYRSRKRNRDSGYDILKQLEYLKQYWR